MFPSEMEGLQELARLSPAALKVLAERYDRLAKLCRTRARFLLLRALEADLARAEHEDKMREMTRTVRRLHRAGLSRAAVIEACPQWDAGVVAYQFRLAVRSHRERNALTLSTTKRPQRLRITPMTDVSLSSR